MTVSTVRLILIDFWAYLKRPDYHRVGPLLQQERPAKRAWQLFRAEFSLVLFLGIVISYPLLRYVEKLTGVSLHQHHHIDDWRAVLSVFTLIPVLEESLFRLILRPTKMHVWCTAFALAILVAGHIYFKISGTLQYLLLTGTWLGIALAAGLTILNKAILEDWWQRHFRWLFYVSAVLFGLAHLTNCTGFTGWHWLLAPIITLPQLTSGFFIGYVRMNYGFWYGVALHAMGNAIAAAIAAVALLSH